MNKGQTNGSADMSHDSQGMIELMIPGNKAGLVIGKGGEMIKQLQVNKLLISTGW